MQQVQASPGPLAGHHRMLGRLRAWTDPAQRWLWRGWSVVLALALAADAWALANGRADGASWAGPRTLGLMAGALLLLCWWRPRTRCGLIGGMALVLAVLGLGLLPGGARVVGVPESVVIALVVAMAMASEGRKDNLVGPLGRHVSGAALVLLTGLWLAHRTLHDATGREQVWALGWSWAVVASGAGLRGLWSVGTYPRERRPALLAGAAVAGLGLVTSLAWMSGAVAWLKLPTVPVVTHSGTGVALFGLGLAVWCAGFGLRWWATACAVPAILLPAINVLADLQGRTTLQHWLPISASLPSHPPALLAPNIAISLTLAVVGLMAVLHLRGREWREVIAWGIGFVLVVLAALVLFGYALGVEDATNWGSFVPMAPLTALGLALVGIGIAFAGVDPRHLTAFRITWLPVLIAGSTVVVTSMVWLTVRQEQQDTAETMATRIMAGVEQRIETEQTEMQRALIRMAQRLSLEARSALRDPLFRHDAQLYLLDMPALSGMATVSPGGTQTLEARNEASRQVVSALMRQASVRTAVMQAQVGTRMADVPVVFPNGKPGSVWVMPLLSPEPGRQEVMLAAVELGPLVRDALAGVVPNASVVVRPWGSPIELYANGLRQGSPTLQGGYPAGRPLLAIDVWPAQSAVRPRLPIVLLLISILSGGLLAVSLRYSALARQRAEYAEQVQHWLAREIDVRVEHQSSLVSALEKIRQSEQRFHGLAMAVADALWDWNLADDSLWWSDGVTTLFGHDPADLGVGIDGWMRYIHPGDLQRVVDSIRAAQWGDASSWSAEYRFARRDGTWAYVLDRGHVIRDESGKAVRMVGGMTDLTPSREIHAAMTREREFLAAMLESLTEGVVACDAEGNLSHYTQVMQSLHGVGQMPVPSGEWAQAYGLCNPVNGQVLAPDRVPLARALAGEKVRDVEMLIRPLDGPSRLVQCNGQAVMSPDGQKLGAVVTMRDITGQRQLQLEREQLSRERGVLLHSMSEGLLGVDGAGRCAFANRAAGELISRAPDSMIGLEVHRLLHGAGCAHEEAGMEGPCPLRHLDQGLLEPLRADSQILREDGTPLPVAVSISAAPGQAGLARVITFTDISQRLREERVDAGKRGVLAMIAERRPVEEALNRLATLFEETFPATIAAIAVLDSDNYRLRLAAPGSLPAEYAQGHRWLEIGAQHGSCGTAAYRGQRVTVADIEHDPLWEEDRASALSHGLKACWCTPIRSSAGEVLATFAVFYPVKGEPTRGELALVDDLAALAGVALEQTAAYRRLATSEERFRSLFQEHPDAVYAFNTHGRFVAVNRGFETMLGVDARSVINHHFEELVAPQDRERTRRHFEEALAGRAVTYESTGLRTNGSRVEVRVTNFPTMSEGKIVGVFGVAHDISQLRAHERSLARALAQAEDMGSQLRRLSQAGVRINSVAGGEVLCQTLADLMRFTLDATHVSIAVTDPRGEAGPRTAQSPPSPVDPQADGGAAGGEGIPFELTATDGGILGQMTVALPEGRELEESSRLVAEQLVQMASAAIERMMLINRLTERDRFFEMSKEIFVVFDPSLGRFHQVNPTFCEVTGHDQKTLCSRPFQEFLHPADRGAAHERIALLDGHRGVRNFSNRYLRRKGGVAWIEWTTVPGADGMIYGVGRDVTERTRAQVALQQSLADLATRNRELQDFAFVASHDLQEPLRKIRSFVDRLIRRHADSLDEQARDYLDRSGKAAARMQLLIENLLAYSRVTSQGKPFQNVALGRVMAGVIEDLEATIENAGAVVETGDLPTVPGDASQLGQVLQNLVANALKFRAADRPPRVVVSAGPLPGEDGTPGWQLRVQDNGIGFEDKYGERIFAPFQRLHGRHEFEGTGIGLAIVRKIVERHRGRTWATGVPGEGACFHVWLPASVDDGDEWASA